MQNNFKCGFNANNLEKPTLYSGHLSLNKSSRETMLQTEHLGNYGSISSRENQFFSNILTSSGAQPASYTIDMGSSFIQGIAAGAWNLTMQFHLVPRSKLLGQCLLPPLPPTQYAQKLSISLICAPVWSGNMWNIPFPGCWLAAMILKVMSFIKSVLLLWNNNLINYHRITFQKSIF